MNIKLKQMAVCFSVCLYLFSVAAVALHFILCFIYSKQTANVKWITSCKLEDSSQEKTDQPSKSFYILNIDFIIIVLYQRVGEDTAVKQKEP